MKWTTKLPTQPGWYWHRQSKYQEGYMVKVSEFEEGEFVVEFEGKEPLQDVGCGYFSGGDWYGPLEKPE